MYPSSVYLYKSVYAPRIQYFVQGKHCLEIGCIHLLLQAITLYFRGLFGMWSWQGMNTMPLVTKPVHHNDLGVLQLGQDGTLE